jgi:hypothetical protein
VRAQCDNIGIRLGLNLRLQTQKLDRTRDFYARAVTAHAPNLGPRQVAGLCALRGFLGAQRILIQAKGL